MVFECRWCICGCTLAKARRWWEVPDGESEGCEWREAFEEHHVGWNDRTLRPLRKLALMSPVHCQRYIFSLIFYSARVCLTGVASWLLSFIFCGFLLKNRERWWTAEVVEAVGHALWRYDLKSAIVSSKFLEVAFGFLTCGKLNIVRYP